MRGWRQWRHPLDAAREVVREKHKSLHEVCDHREESGVWARRYDHYTDENVCRYCGEDL